MKTKTLTSLTVVVEEEKKQCLTCTTTEIIKNKKMNSLILVNPIIPVVYGCWNVAKYIFIFNIFLSQKLYMFMFNQKNIFLL